MIFLFRQGGGPADLEFAQWLSGEVAACELVKHVEISSVCPLHTALDVPYSQLLDKLISLRSFCYHARGHGIPLPLASSLSSHALHPDLVSFHCHVHPFQSITGMMGLPLGQVLTGLENVVLHQPKTDWMPAVIDGGDVEQGDGPPPLWLTDNCLAHWPIFEKSFCIIVSAFLLQQAPTLKTLDLRMNPYFDMLAPYMLRVPDSDPEMHQLNIESSQSDINANLLRVIPFPLLTSLTLPGLDLTDPILATILLSSPNLRSLSLTHTPFLPPPDPSNPTHAASFPFFVPATALLQLEKLSIDVRPAKVFAFMQLEMPMNDVSIVCDVVDGLDGKVLRELNIWGSARIGRKECKALGRLGTLEKLTIETDDWKTKKHIKIFSELASLRLLHTLRLNFPPYLTSPLYLPPFVCDLLEEDGYNLWEVCVVLHDFFHGEIDVEDEEAEDDEEEAEDGQAVKDEGDTRDGAEDDAEPDEKVSSSGKGEKSTEGRPSSSSNAGEKDDEKASTPPQSDSSVPSSSSLPSFPSSLDKIRPPNANLEHFIGLISSLALQNPLTSVHWTFDSFYNVLFKITQPPPVDLSVAGEREAPRVVARLDLSPIEMILALDPDAGGA